MKIEIISTKLKEKLQPHNGDTVSMSPWETADFLLLCGEILIKYIEYSNKQVEPDSEAFLSKSEIAKIDNLFRELGDNFFPMAHTTAPLRVLKIVNARQYEDLNNRVENLLMTFLHHNEDNFAEIIAINDRNLRLSREIFDRFENLKREIRTVLNP